MPVTSTAVTQRSLATVTTSPVFSSSHPQRGPREAGNALARRPVPRDSAIGLLTSLSQMLSQSVRYCSAVRLNSPTQNGRGQRKNDGTRNDRSRPIPGSCPAAAEDGTTMLFPNLSVVMGTLRAHRYSSQRTVLYIPPFST